MKISQQVENILKASREARNSDKELLIIYMQKFGMELTPKQIALFKKMPSTETIRRTRQQLQQEGKYPADESVDQARFDKFKEVKQNIKYETPESLLETMGYKVLPFGE